MEGYCSCTNHFRSDELAIDKHCKRFDALEQCREETVGPHRFAARVVARGIAQHDIGRQVLVLGSQRIADPASESRSPLKDLACLDHRQRFRMIVVLGEH